MWIRSILVCTCGGADFLTSFFTVPKEGSLGTDGSDSFGVDLGAAFLTSFSPFLRTCALGRHRTLAMSRRGGVRSVQAAARPDMDIKRNAS